MGARVDFLVRRLLEEGEALTGQLKTLPAADWEAQVYASSDTAPRWQMRDILAHLVSAEGYLQMMIADIAAGGPGAPAGIDIDAVNAVEVAALVVIQPAALIERLAAARSKTIYLVSHLTDDDLDRRGNHPLLGEMALEDFVKLIYRHDKMHMRDVGRAGVGRG